MNGRFIISLDYELLWGLSGWNNNQITEYLSHIQQANFALREILNLLEKYDVKVTIAFVGCMNFQTEEELLTTMNSWEPQYKRQLFSAFSSVVPYARQKNAMNYLFATKYIEELSHKSLVELGSHTFSHYYCLEEGSNPMDFRQDIKHVVQNARKSRIHLSTIIFPRNQVSDDYLLICAKEGFTHYRGMLNTGLYKSEKTQSRYSIKGALRFLDAYINLSGYQTYTWDSCFDSVLVNVPGSRFLRPYSKKLRWFEWLKIRRIKQSMEYAAKHGEIFHLWWHPHNFGLDTVNNLDNLEQLCKHYKLLSQKYAYKSCFISEITA